MKLFTGSLVIKNHHRLGWRWPHYYQPTCLHKHGLSLGPLTIFWAKDYSGRGL